MDDERDDAAEWAHQELMNERMREELDCLVVIHKHGLEGTAQCLAAHLGLSKEFQQEISQSRTGTRHAQAQ